MIVLLFSGLAFSRLNVFATHKIDVSYKNSFIRPPLKVAYFLSKRANKKAVLAIIKKLLHLMKREVIIIGQDANFESTPINIKRHPITTNTLGSFVI